MEKGNVYGRHLLTAQDNARAHPCHLAVLVVRASHLGPSDTVIRALQKLHHLRLDVVILVLVEVHHGIDRVARLLIEARYGRIAEVRREVSRREERHERGPHVALARALRAEEVKDGEGAGATLNHIAEEGGHPVEQADASVLAPYRDEARHVLREGRIVERAVDEPTLQAVAVRIVCPRVFGADGRVHRQEVAALLLRVLPHADNPVIVRIVKVTILVHPIREHVEVLSRTVPHGMEQHRRLRLVVEVRLKLEHVRFGSSEKIVAHTLQLLAESLQRVEVVHVEHQQLLLSDLTA